MISMKSERTTSSQELGMTELSVIDDSMEDTQAEMDMPAVDNDSEDEENAKADTKAGGKS